MESLLGCDDILTLLGIRARITHLPRFSTVRPRGSYDLAVVEGCVARPEDVEVLQAARDGSAVLVALGTCAAAGGPCSSMAPVGEIVKVDQVLGGCPVAVPPALALLRILLDRREPVFVEQDVCDECRLRSLPCVADDEGCSCLGPVTQAGCGALCPSFGRGCSHCAGPSAALRLGAVPAPPAIEGSLAGVFLTAWTPRRGPAHPWAEEPS